MRCAWGRAASAASWARRSLAAATICMALVIFWVDLTESIRFLRSFSDGIVLFAPYWALSHVVLLDVVQGLLELGAGIVAEFLFGRDGLEQVGMLAAQGAEDGL